MTDNPRRWDALDEAQPLTASEVSKIAEGLSDVDIGWKGKGWPEFDTECVAAAIRTIIERDKRIAELEIKVARLTAESDSRDRALDEIHRRAGVKRDGLCGIFGWIDDMKERGGE
jgi:hypothetical protein